jgi:hypothetical protein
MTTRAKYIGGVQSLFDDAANFEFMARFAALQYRDDFIGAGSQVIPAAGSAENGADWVKKIVGTGPPTVAAVANAAGGQIACALTATSEKQDAALYWDDKKAIDVTKGAVFEARFQLSVLPSAAGVQAVVGLASNWIDGPDNNTCYLQIGATANGALLARSFDGTTTKSVAAGVTLLTTDWAILRIDATDVTDVKMFINGVQVTATGLINFAATGSLAVLQPYVGMYKPSGTGVGTLTLDYVKAWMNRA